MIEITAAMFNAGEKVQVEHVPGTGSRNKFHRTNTTFEQMTNELYEQLTAVII
jgi:hypothetical protein